MLGSGFCTWPHAEGILRACAGGAYAYGRRLVTREFGPRNESCYRRCSRFASSAPRTIVTTRTIHLVLQRNKPIGTASHDRYFPLRWRFGDAGTAYGSLNASRITWKWDIYAGKSFSVRERRARGWMLDRKGTFVGRVTRDCGTTHLAADNTLENVIPARMYNEIWLTDRLRLGMGDIGKPKSR